MTSSLLATSFARWVWPAFRVQAFTALASVGRNTCDSASARKMRLCCLREKDLESYGRGSDFSGRKCSCDLDCRSQLFTKPIRLLHRVYQQYESSIRSEEHTSELQS